MGKFCSKHVYNQTSSLLITLFFIFFFSVLHHLSFTVADDMLSPYTPSEKIFLACGLSGSTINTIDGRTWIGDVGTRFFPLDQQNSTSTVSFRDREPPYSSSRLSDSQFSYRFSVTTGQKFIRLYFYPTYNSKFKTSRAVFSVKAGSFTLLSNFSASLAADELGKETFFKEFCINVAEDQRILNITFSPSTEYQNSTAFINGIEIVSMPTFLYFTNESKQSVSYAGVKDIPFRTSNSNALETLYRINVGESLTSPTKDTGMYRTWFPDGDYLTDASPSDVLVNNSTIVLGFILIHNYSAPVTVYNSARTMGKDKKMNQKHNLTWEFEVDSGFLYLLRLHFCEFQAEVTKVGDRVFDIYIGNRVAEANVDIIRWTGGNGIPLYRDYPVLMGSKGKQNLSIALHPALERTTKFSDAILNGLEIFKVDNGGNLAVPNPDILYSPPSVAAKPSSQSKKSKGKVIAIVCGVVLVSCFVVVCLAFLSWRQFSKKSRKFRGSSLTSDLCTQFSLSEIKAATNNFDSDLIIGAGGFGNVYKGYINGRGATPVVVAIKRLNPGSQQGAQEFKTEIAMLSRLIHIHLVSLIGYCNDDGEMILVYDFMARGTVRDHLYNSNNPPLPWNQRLQICIGAARGLQYLHTGTKHVIIHRDVKTTNILLDDNWVAKVSDFGLSKFGPNSMSKTHVSTAVKGSIGYLDPEYYRLQQLTEKSDVYSFGVVLLEVLSNRPPILRTVSDRNQASLALWGLQCYHNGTIDELVDPFLKDKINSECLNKFAEVAISCLNDDGSQRPSTSDVVRGLEFVFQQQESADQEKEKLAGETELSTKNSDNRSLTRDVFSEIIDPQGR